MSFSAEPTPGEYYRDTDLEVNFVVVEMDEYEGIITIRREEEMDTVAITLDDWDEMTIEPADAPAQNFNMENQFRADGDEIVNEVEPDPDADLFDLSEEE
ncbi:MAG: hypothetical protein KAT25_08910 [Sulfuriflexus sp.]|nr:hypothetical protein [Sulfuriflexus sp.]